MAIVIEQRRGHYAPRVICDVCGRPIEGAGNAEFDASASPATVYHSHKECTHALRAAHPEVERWGWAELNEHFALLVHNTKIDLEEGMRIWQALEGLE